MNAAHRKKNARPGEPGQASFGKRKDTDTPDNGTQEYDGAKGTPHHE